jgi:nucleotide-binding universal stress UspA family protein
MKTILFPTDFSPHANNAFAYALHMAELLGAELLLLHAYHYTNTGNFFIPAELIDGLNLEEKEKALTELKRYEQKIQQEPGKKVNARPILVQGFAIDEILELEKTHDIDLIIMGTHGATSMQDRVLGTVTATVIEKASCPVLAIPAQCTWRGIRHIAYGTNFEEKDLRVPEGLPELARLFHARISCVHINPEPSDGWERLQQFFREELFRLEIDPDQMELFILKHPDIIEGLNTFTQENEVDILATLTHKHGFIERILQKSITRKISHVSHVPLLAFHK